MARPQRCTIERQVVDADAAGNPPRWEPVLTRYWIELAAKQDQATPIGSSQGHVVQYEGLGRYSSAIQVQDRATLDATGRRLTITAAIDEAGDRSMLKLTLLEAI